MSAVVRMLRESFVPLLGLLLGLIALTAWLDGKAADLAQKETVIRLQPLLAQWDSSRLSESGIVETMAGVALEPSQRPEILAAREKARRGDVDGAAALLSEALAKAPDDVGLLGESGVVELRRGHGETAANLLDRALTKTPDDFSLHFNRGLAAVRMGVPSEARQHYQRALELRPKSFDARFNLGLLELDEGRTSEATAHFEAAVELGSGTGKARALFSLGVAQARAGNETLALATYDKAIEYQPTYLLPRYNQATIHAARPDPASKERAAALVAQLIALAPDFAPAWFLKGRMASTGGDKEAALNAYEKAASYAPSFFKARYNAALVALDMDRTDQAKERFERLTVDFPTRAEPFFNLGRILHAKEDYGGAVAQYQKAIALKPKGYPEATLDMAVSLRADGKLDEALATLDALIAAEPEMSSAYLNRGLVLTKLKRPDDARASLEKAIALRPDYAFAWYNLGKLEGGRDRHEPAVAAYQKALAADPGMLKAALNLGVELANLDRYDEAIGAYRKALALSPDYPPAHFNLGLALRALGRYDEAAQEYARVIALDPDNIAARQNLGVLYSRRGQHELAIQTYHDALDIEPGKVAIRVNLAGELRRLGRPAEARSELERARALEPKHRGAIAALAALEVDEGHLDVALALLQPALASGKASGEMRAIEARVRLAQDDLAAASGAVEAAMKAAPDDATTLAIGARVAWRSGKRDEARQLYGKARGIDAEDLEVQRIGADLDTNP